MRFFEKTEEFRVDDLITRQVCYHSCWYVGLLLPELGLTMAFLRTGLRARAIYTALRNNVACMSSVPQPIVNPEIKFNKVGHVLLKDNWRSISRNIEVNVCNLTISNDLFSILYRFKCACSHFIQWYFFFKGMIWNKFT